MKLISTFDLEKEIADKLYSFNSVLKNNSFVIAGTDEAGRGPLCGPVVAAAVAFKSFDIDIPIKITDSKKMNARARASAYDWIVENTIWAIGQCSVDEIDNINILHASMLAMQRAIENLSLRPDFVLVDGNRLPQNLVNSDGCNRLDCNLTPGRAIVKGDLKSLSIAAASIIAKQTRDKIMQDLSIKFPEYGWDKNSGYPTKTHLHAIKMYGITDHHRKTFGPIKKRINNDNSNI